MRDRAYAKINIALDVFNKREDGYHDISSVMIPISFYDDLEISISDVDNYTYNRTNIEFNEQNSIYKMIEAVRKKYGIDAHYSIVLNKCVPLRAGLGGGTSDAASTLRLLKRLHHLKPTYEEEKELCMSVGADVLFSYINKPAIVSGIGDVVEPIKVKKTYYVLIVKPKYGISTKQAYEMLDMEKANHPNIEALKNALANGDDLAGLLGNSLEQPALLLNKEIDVIKNKLINAGASNVAMSGSGSAVFTLCESEEEMMRLYEIFKNSVYFVRFAKTLGN